MRPYFLDSTRLRRFTSNAIVDRLLQGADLAAPIGKRIHNTKSIIVD